MPQKEMHPDEYGELAADAIRPATIGPNDVVLGFQISDLDDVGDELSVLLRVRGFERVDRLLSRKGRIVDVWFGDDELVVLERTEVHHYRGGRFGTPASTATLPIEGAKTIVGTKRDALYAIGSGIARFDGKLWKAIDVGDDVELTAGAIHEGKLYAAGKSGAFFEVSGDVARKLTTPRGEDLDVNAIHVGARGVFSLAAQRGVALHGPLSALKPLPSPPGVDHFVGVTEYDGATYWSTLGDDGGTAVFVQRGKELERIHGEMCLALRVCGGFVFGTGEERVVQFDGEEWRALALEYDDATGAWTATKADDARDDADEDDDD